MFLLLILFIANLPLAQAAEAIPNAISPMNEEFLHKFQNMDKASFKDATKMMALFDMAFDATVTHSRPITVPFGFLVHHNHQLGVSYASPAWMYRSLQEKPSSFLTVPFGCTLNYNNDGDQLKSDYDYLLSRFNIQHYSKNTCAGFSHSLLRKHVDFCDAKLTTHMNRVMEASAQELKAFYHYTAQVLQDINPTPKADLAFLNTSLLYLVHIQRKIVDTLFTSPTKEAKHYCLFPDPSPNATPVFLHQHNLGNINTQPMDEMMHALETLLTTVDSMLDDVNNRITRYDEIQAKLKAEKDLLHFQFLAHHSTLDDLQKTEASSAIQIQHQLHQVNTILSFIQEHEVTHPDLSLELKKPATDCYTHLQTLLPRALAQTHIVLERSGLSIVLSIPHIKAVLSDGKGHLITDTLTQCLARTNAYTEPSPNDHADCAIIFNTIAQRLEHNSLPFMVQEGTKDDMVRLLKNILQPPLHIVGASNTENLNESLTILPVDHNHTLPFIYSLHVKFAQNNNGTLNIPDDTFFLLAR